MMPRPRGGDMSGCGVLFRPGGWVALWRRMAMIGACDA